ncbi:MAG: HD domain-containing phosphohydrolase, partial [Verrucomicrobiota bacterium]
EDVLLHYHAHIDKYMGDAILAEFGAPVDYERHALLAVVAGLKMQETLRRGNYPWNMRVAITTGETIVGLIGHKRQSYTALGDVVNLASRVEKLCPPGKITIDETTYEEIKMFCVGRRKAAAESEIGNTDLLVNIDDLKRRLAEDPRQKDVLKKLAFLFLEANDLVEAQVYLGRVIELDPNDTQVKLAYADVSFQLEAGGNIAIRGKRKRIHLYEIDGVRNPLLDRDRLPQSIYDRYHEELEKLVEYPEDLVLPVECIDASVGHSRVVGFLSYAIADALDLPDLEKKQILEAAYLADIGKTIVPHHILNHAERMNEVELEEFSKHCREGVRKLKQLGYDSEPIFDIVASHHENFNGTGYPAQLAGDQIPLGARIVAVADAYADLTSWRPYRDPWEHRAAFAELERQTHQGKFDPKVLACLGKLLNVQNHLGVSRGL